MPKLKLQYFGHMMWRADSLEKTLSWESWGKVEKGTTEDEMVGWHHPSTQWTWVWANSGRYCKTVKSGMLQSMGLQRVLPAWASKQQLLNIYRIYEFLENLWAWKIPWMEEPGRRQSMGSLKVRNDWVTSLSLFTFMHWRRKWQPIPVFLPGESQGQGSLVGCRLWGHIESDMTEVT